jgi:small-conductance mechanosensitive channel
MNIKFKAAMDTAVLVGVCLFASGLFALAMKYVPWLALTVAVVGLTYVVYKFNLSDLEMKEKYPSIYEEKK